MWLQKLEKDIVYCQDISRSIGPALGTLNNVYGTHISFDNYLCFFINKYHLLDFDNQIFDATIFVYLFRFCSTAVYLVIFYNRTRSKVKKAYVINCHLLYCALVPCTMSVSVIVCQVWPLVHFCDPWPSPVVFIVRQGHFHFNH